MAAMIGFVIVALGVLLGIHYYLATRLIQFLSLHHLPAVYIVFLILALLYPLAGYLERKFDGQVIGAFYTLASVWMGVMFIGLAIFLVHDLLWLIAYAGGVTLSPVYGWVAMGLTLLLAGYGMFHAQHVALTPYTLQAPGLSDETTIVQLSDLHIGAINGKAYLTEMVRRTNALSPDVVVITGDLFDGSGHLRNGDLSPLERLSPKYGTYFIIGNHERYYGLEKALALIPKNVRILRDEVVRAGPLQLIGIDYPENEREKKNPVLAGLSAKLEKGIPSIVLFHAPNGLDDFERSPAFLQLSGHTHNGQVWPFAYLDHLAYRHVYGKHKVGDGKWIIISSGAGTWGPPMRLASTSEIVRITLTTA